MFFLGILGLLPAQEVKRYTGIVGSRDAEFALLWQQDGTVIGRYYCPEGKRIEYLLKGSNRHEGVLELDEFTDGQLTSHIHLRKAVENRKIVWRGVMKNRDGRELAVRMLRTMEEPGEGGNSVLPGEAPPGAMPAPGPDEALNAPPQAEGQVNHYSGIVGTRRAEFDLAWAADLSVAGSYLCPDGKGIRYALRGSNKEKGILVLDEFTGDNLTSTISLRKQVVGSEIIWKGTMKNLDGRELPVRFSRRAADDGDTADKEGEPGAPSRDGGELGGGTVHGSGDADGLGPSGTNGSGVKPMAGGGGAPKRTAVWDEVKVEVRQTTSWEFPPDAKKFLMQGKFVEQRSVSKMSKPALEGFAGVLRAGAPGVYFLPAEILAAGRDGDELVVKFSLRPYESEIQSKTYRADLSEVSLRISYPDLPPALAAGKSCRVWFDEAGGISQLELGHVVVSHLRPRGDGSFEIKYLPEDAEVGDGLAADDFTDANLKTCRPDKFTFDALKWRMMTFDKRLGLTVRVDDPDRMELEIHGLDAMGSEDGGGNWTSVDAKGGGEVKVPEIQWAYDAGLAPGTVSGGGAGPKAER